MSLFFIASVLFIMRQYTFKPEPAKMFLVRIIFLDSYLVRRGTPSHGHIEKTCRKLYENLNIQGFLIKGRSMLKCRIKIWEGTIDFNCIASVLWVRIWSFSELLARFRRSLARARICKPAEESIPSLASRYDDSICRTGPPDYIGWRNRFLGSRNFYKYGHSSARLAS